MYPGEWAQRPFLFNRMKWRALLRLDLQLHLPIDVLEHKLGWKDIHLQRTQPPNFPRFLKSALGNTFYSIIQSTVSHLKKITPFSSYICWVIGMFKNILKFIDKEVTPCLWDMSSKPDACQKQKRVAMLSTESQSVYGGRPWSSRYENIFANLK